MELEISKIISEIENKANENDMELYIDNSSEFNFYVVLNEKGDLGAIGRIRDTKTKSGQRLYFCKFNHKVYKYAVDEGFNSSSIYNSFKDKLFLELKQDEFINYISSK
jgi:hypothetical protein